MDKNSKLAEYVSSAHDLEAFVNYKAVHHTYYKWYSTKARVDYDLEQSAIFLSNGTRWNDIDDRDAFNSVANKKRFGLCLSNSKSESVAMWMLYGGMGRAGVMIDFKRDMLVELKNLSSLELGVFKNDVFKTLQTIKADEYSIKLQDVLYVAKEDDGYYTIKKQDETVKDVDEAVISAYKGITKRFPWNYENECRLIVEVDEDIIIPVAKDATHIKLVINEMKDKLKGRIYHAPNYDASIGYVYSKSNLKGSIDWDLCSSCKRKID